MAPMWVATEELRNERIGDYAIIGDTRSAALVSRNGSIDWLCWPRFNSRSIFARILDAEKGGCFSIRPRSGRAQRRYIENTNVLETVWETETGRVRVLDLMLALDEDEKRRRLLPYRQLLRRVEGLEGSVDIEVVYQPRPDYARIRPVLELRRGDTIWCADGPEVWHMRSDAEMHVDPEGGTARAAFALRRGEKKYFALSYETHAPAVFGAIGDPADDEIERTIAWWRAWCGQFQYEGPYADEVLRSALALKLLVYAPSGGVVAAPTTSLPEKIGGIRNWDYRYCWLRDASFTVGVLYDCGFHVEGSAFADWLLYATRLTQPSLQILYDVFGEYQLPEKEIERLAGYCGSRPVRVGNQAHGQFQLDVYGEVLGAVEEYTNHGEHLYRDTRKMICKLADIVVRRWREPDSGIWEKRSGRVQHVHAKVMAWSALDCAERLAEKGHLPVDASLWASTKDEIKKVVLADGFNTKLNSFVSILGGDELDASLLYIARVGFLEGDDPRLLGTIDAIRSHLGQDDLLYRYPQDTDDGLPPGEGAFLPCSFWLVEALAIAKRFDEAHDLYQKLLARRNDVGLLSEECDVASGALIGNFPQALTHIGLMNAAMRLHQPVARRGVEANATAPQPVEKKEKQPGK